MELFTLTLPSSLHQDLSNWAAVLTEQMQAELHMAADSPSAKTVEFRIGTDNQLICAARLPEFQLLKHGKSVFRTSSAAIAKLVIDELEMSLIRSIIERKCRNDAHADTLVIERYCHELLHGKEWDGLGAKFHDADRNRRISKVAAELEQYLSEQGNLNLEGFITFRLLNYRQELTEIVDYALDEYVLDRQYQEFISLLKYFVFLQETKVTKVHLLHKGAHEFVMYNESFQLLDPNPTTDRIVAEMLETEMNLEDMVISSLISISPKSIHLHTRQPDMQVIRTIKMIFDDRVTICAQCPSCSSSLDGLIKP